MSEVQRNRRDGPRRCSLFCKTMCSSQEAAWTKKRARERRACSSLLLVATCTAALTGSVFQACLSQQIDSKREAASPMLTGRPVPGVSGWRGGDAKSSLQLMLCTSFRWPRRCCGRALVITTLIKVTAGTDGIMVHFLGVG